MNEGQSKDSRPKEKPSVAPKPGTPMDKFNKAMRKILSVPKKDLGKK